MTAVQQYWLIENDEYLVSGLYPILQLDDSIITDGEVTLAEGQPRQFFDESFVVDADPELTFAQVLLTVTSWDQTWFEGGARDVEPSLTFGATPSAVITYDHPFQVTEDHAKDVEPSLTFASVVQVVITYDHAFQTTEDHVKDVEPSLTTGSVT